MKRYAPLMLLVLIAACTDVPTGVEQDTDLSNELKVRQVTVMTRNLYLGEDFTRVTNTTLPIPVAVAQFWQAVQVTNFPVRAKALADEIAEYKPDLIGLQEVSLYRMQDPGDYLTGQTTPNAETVVLDFLEILMHELSARGLDYKVVNVVDNFDVELPAATSPTTFIDLRLSDRDVILARPHVRILNSVEDQYTATLPVLGLQIPRGYGYVQVRDRSAFYTFVNTHLETEMAYPIQEAQATELMQILGTLDGPIILAGDINSGAVAGGAFDTHSYEIITTHYTDAFTYANPGIVENTCCQAAHLDNVTSQLTGRIDGIFVSNSITSTFAEIIGDERLNRTVPPFWASDHAGVVAVLEVPRESQDFKLQAQQVWGDGHR